MRELPIDIVLPDFLRALGAGRNIVLTAEPGAGKTTRVPVAMLGMEHFRGKRIIMLEPRRLAAVRSAEFIAASMGEKVGETVGYRIRGESAISKQTRLEVVTEGVLTRMLQNDAALEGVGAVIFDEFHERSIHADLGLALCLDIQQHLRPDLKLIAMSATIDGASVAGLMGDAPVISSTGRSFPVGVTYLERSPKEYIEQAAVSGIIRALREQDGDVLVFLPGQREIRRTAELLQERSLGTNINVHQLYGEASPAQQRAALMPAPTAMRKVILSTNIAETSLTIDGVSVVVDSGVMRTATFDASRGMSGLVTIPVSLASAEQRKGRAGRQRAGHCYRLWSEAHHASLMPYSKPEIIVTDLAPLAMEMALWGDVQGGSLRFLDRPPEKHLAQAIELLQYLGALDRSGAVTSHGKAMSVMPVHPRFAHMLLRGKELGAGALACDLAAMLEERDLLRGRPGTDVDLHSRYIAFRERSVSDKGNVQRIMEQSVRFRKLLDVRREERSVVDAPLGPLLALAYPDRVGKRRQGERYQLSANMVATLPKESALSKEEYLAVGDTDGAGSDVRILLAEPVSSDEVVTLFRDQCREEEEVKWDATSSAIVARRMTRFGAIVIGERAFTPSPELTVPIILDVVRAEGLTILPWSDEDQRFRQRSEWIRKRALAESWPDLSDAALLSKLDEWLSPFLGPVTRKNHLSKLEMEGILRSMFDFQRLQLMERLAPTYLTVPTGSRIALDYGNDPPILAVRIQEMFGETGIPSVGNGKVPVLLHLLSPARRPLAVTQDLQSFWKNAYIQVRKDMRGEYPKHYWPENPLDAEPTTRTKRHLNIKE